MNNLGFLYEYGLGVSRDPKEAAKWYLAGAEKNDPKAQANYGVMCGEGTGGVPRDLVQGYKWLKLSALQGDPVGKKYMLDFENGEWAIATNQVAEAERLVQEFRAAQRRK